MQYAPIALFTYNRPKHTRQVVESLLKNAESKDSILYIFSDGPKTPEKKAGVERTREYIHTISGFKEVHVIEREQNWGLANSLIAGISELTETYGKAIVVEDDLVLSPFFLDYMNKALTKYENEERVSAISAFLNPIDCEAPNTFFLHYFACWGWGTWKRAWDMFNPDANELLRLMRWKKKSFDMENSSGFYGMLFCQSRGLIDSWAIRFYASSFIADKLVLFPGVSYASQTGLDGSGVHCGAGAQNYSKVVLAQDSITLNDIELKQNNEMYQAFVRFYSTINKSHSAKYKWVLVKSFVRRLLALDYKK